MSASSQQDTKPFWSVVVPLYNKEDFIEDTLRSVLGQVGNELFEVIVVDDGSRDQGPARVLALGDPRVRLVRQQNGGVSAARNRGIEEARGEWVAFLDADDHWHPHALEAYRKLLNLHRDVSMLGGQYVRVPSADVQQFEFSPHSSNASHRVVENLPALALESGLPFFTSSVAIKRTLLNQLEFWFPAGESMGEDLDLWLRSSERGRLVVTSDVIALYRTELESSLIGKYRELELLPVWRRLRQRASSGAFPAGLRRSSLRLVAEMEVTLARRLATQGRKRDAWLHLWGSRVAVTGYRWWVTLLGLTMGSNSLLRR